MHMIITCNNVCMCGLEDLKPSPQTWAAKRKQWPWEESKGIYKQPNLQKRVT